MTRPYDADGDRIDPRDHLDAAELADLARSRRTHPAGSRKGHAPRLRVLPAVDPETGLDDEGWAHGAEYPKEIQ